MKTATFGTDGIRGIYGKTITEETAYRLGAALGKKGNVLIGRDNRLSSPSLAEALAGGVKAAGSAAQAVGCVTTPALYYLLTKLPFAYGVMITASHNPPSHNGLKVFTKEGKPNEEIRREIEDAMLCVDAPRSCAIPLVEDPSPLALYETFFREKIGRLDGLRVVVDYAGGAGYAFKGLLGSLGAQVLALNARESGDKINENSGALHPENCA